MNGEITEALARTLLLMRDEVCDGATQHDLVGALTDTNVVLAADARNLMSHSAQTAFVTAAMLMARSGHRVHLAAPDVDLLGPQPPLPKTRLTSALVAIGSELLPGRHSFSILPPRSKVDLVVRFGDSSPRYRGRHCISINASSWGASITDADHVMQWRGGEWPCGGLAAGALAAVEAFKCAMHRLRSRARDPARFDELFRHAGNITLELAPPETPQITALGDFDFISGGAITNASLYALARLPRVRGRARVVEPEDADITNLNRYALLLVPMLHSAKALALRTVMPNGLELGAMPYRYERKRDQGMGELAPHVLVGVDDIPVRWEVQEEMPLWLGIGATSHWDAMSSTHARGSACARCLHPRDEPVTAPIPTVAYVSFFAGLFLAVRFIQALAQDRVTATVEQYTYFCPLRPELLWRTPVARRADCPTCTVCTARVA